MSSSMHGRVNLRPAFTLIEMLVTLSLLVLLMLVAISWVTHIMKRQQQGVQDQQWYQAANLVMAQFERDLLAINILDEARLSRNPRVEIEGDQLLIHTIDQGAAVAVRYVFDSEAGTLHRLRGESRTHQTPMLGSVELCSFEVQPHSATRTLPVLRITLISESNQQSKRSFSLKPQDVQR